VQRKGGKRRANRIGRVGVRGHYLEGGKDGKSVWTVLFCHEKNTRHWGKRWDFPENYRGEDSFSPSGVKEREEGNKFEGI